MSKNNRQPSLGELLATPSAASSPNAGLEKAASQAQVGEVFEALTKEAKEDLIGTMGWAGRVFGEQLNQALSGTVEKLAGLVAEIKVASASYGNITPQGVSTGSPPNVGPATAVNEGTPGSRGWSTQAEKARFAAETKAVERPPGPGGANFPGEENSGAAKPQPAPKPSEKNSADRSEVLARLRRDKGNDHDADDKPCSMCHHSPCTCSHSKESQLAEIGKDFNAALRAELAKAAAESSQQ